MIFEEVAADSFFVGGAAHGTFVRIQIDQMARTLPGPVIREWWVKNVEQGHRALGQGPRLRLGVHDHGTALRPVVAAGTDPAAV